jgi:hypothetical protein
MTLVNHNKISCQLGNLSDNGNYYDFWPRNIEFTLAKLTKFELSNNLLGFSRGRKASQWSLAGFNPPLVIVSEAGLPSLKTITRAIHEV